METFKTFWCWLFCQQKRERKDLAPIETLKRSAQMTAKCRYNASIRLEHQGKFAFFTTTVLSLGLIFIPLMQNAGVPLAFKPNVLNMMQIFLAVSILVYSVVIGTSRFEVRAEKFDECAHKLNELIRELDYACKTKECLEKGKDKHDEKEEFDEHHRRYTDILTDSENHIRGDYYLAKLQRDNEDIITGLPRLYYYFLSFAARSIAYLIPIFMILFEVIFITDMIGATSILVKYFNNGVAISGS